MTSKINKNKPRRARAYAGVIIDLNGFRAEPSGGFEILAEVP